MSVYSRRTMDGARWDVRGRLENKEQPMAASTRETKWLSEPSRYKDIGRNKLDTVITGHLTQEQIDAYQQYFRIEEISDILRTSQQQHKDVISLLPSGNHPENIRYHRDPSPPPKYDSSGNRTNTREECTRVFLEKERHYLVEVAASSIKNYMSPIDYRKPIKTCEKVYIPVKSYPDINFVGLLLGPRGNTLRQLQEESGARLAIRGKGSVKDGKSTSSNNDDDDSNNALSSTSFSNPNLDTNADDLHVVITSDSQSKIAKAIKLTNEIIEKAISSPVGQNDLKRGQLRELAILNGTLRETKPYNPEAYQKRQHARKELDISQIICKVCGKVGHFARDCKFKNQRIPNGRDDNNLSSKLSNDKDQLPSQNPPLDSKRETEREEILPPWKKKKPNAPLPPWQKAQPPPPLPSNGASIPPPPATSFAPPPPPLNKLPPPPPSLNSTVPPPPPPPAITKKPPPPPPNLSIQPFESNIK